MFIANIGLNCHLAESAQPREPGWVTLKIDAAKARENVPGALGRSRFVRGTVHAPDIRLKQHLIDIHAAMGGHDHMLVGVFSAQR